MHDPLKTNQELIEQISILQQQIAGLGQSKVQLKLFLEAVKKSEEKYRKAFYTNQDSVCINRLNDGVYVEVNEGHTKSTGYEEAEIIGRSSLEINVWENPADRERFVKELRLSGKVENLEARFRRKDGSIFIGLMSACIIDLDDAPHSLNVTKDITDRKRMENALRESEERYRDLVENANSIIMKVDQSGIIIFSNGYAQKFFGYCEDEMLGTDMKVFLPQIESTTGRNLGEMVDSLLKNPDEFVENINENIRKNGERVWISWRNKGIRDSKGNIIGNLAIGQDITEQRRAEETLRERSVQLEAANKELEAFTYTVSHDLRAPLRAIDGFTKMLVQSAYDKIDQEEKRKFDVIRANAQKMDQLIEDFLAFSHIGHQDISFSGINMGNLINQVWEEWRVTNAERRMELKTGDLPQAFGDSGLIKQVLSNLMSNAIKFTRSQELALIEIGGKIDGHVNLYYVKDNGVGFNMRYYDKLFGVFQRLHNERDFEGTGVGLAIVQRIIQRHGGRLWAEGKEGEGAVFYFTLPNRKYL